MHVNWHTQFRFRHIVCLVKRKNHTSTDTSQIETTRTTKHVTSKWHSKKITVDVNRHSFSCFWHFGFEAERQMKYYAKHTHWLDLWKHSNLDRLCPKLSARHWHGDGWAGSATKEVSSRVLGGQVGGQRNEGSIFMGFGRAGGRAVRRRKYLQGFWVGRRADDWMIVSWGQVGGSSCCLAK